MRVQRDGTLYVLETPFWTKNGAQETANHLNKTFGALLGVANALGGHNYWVTTTGKIPRIQEALEIARREIPTKKEK